jgi:hypothetical protein
MLSAKLNYTGACLRFRFVVGEVLPLHPLRRAAYYRLRGRCRLNLRVHLRAARLPAEQLAGLHGEHPASSSHNACDHLPSSESKLIN